MEEESNIDKQFVHFILRGREPVLPTENTSLKPCLLNGRRMPISELKGTVANHNPLPFIFK